MTAKKRNPQDATLRNVRSFNARLVALTKRVRSLEVTVLDLAADLQSGQAWFEVQRPKPKGKK